MARNEILDELHLARAKLLEAAGGDLKRYVREADGRLKASGRPIAKLPAKPKQRRKKTG
jgi:hypothetical protein